MKKTLLPFFISLLLSLPGFCQKDTVRTLFIGNSYTYYNDMPLIVQNMASSRGDVFIKDQNTPGGWYLSQHWTDNVTQTKLKSRFWDYVVVQQQSQAMAEPIASVRANSFPYGKKFDSLRRIYSPLGQTVYYMTWGRKNGDKDRCATNPPVCTYQGMDDLVRQRYLQMQSDNQALISPVGAVWRRIRETHPEIELYDADESHPSPAGSYLSACTFYTVLFKKDPTLVTYNFTLNATVAGHIKEAVKSVVFNSLSTWNTYKKPASSKVKVSITSPVNGSSLSKASTTVAANASTSVGTITQVAFYINGVLKNTQLNTPYSVDLPLQNGLNTIIAIAQNSNGDSNCSRSDVTITTTNTSYYIINRWQNTYLYDNNQVVKYSTSPTGATYQWTIEDVGGNKRLRNVGTGRYLNIENRLGYVQCAALPNTFTSSQWALESYSGFTRIRNIWQSTNYIHVENRNGNAQYGVINATFWSSHWTLQAVGTARLSSESNESDNVKIYPNPTTAGSLTIELKKDNAIRSVKIYNIHGNLVAVKENIGNDNTVNFTDLNKGVYMMVIEGSLKTYSKKIIVP